EQRAAARARDAAGAPARRARRLERAARSRRGGAHAPSLYGRVGASRPRWARVAAEGGRARDDAADPDLVPGPRRRPWLLREPRLRPPAGRAPPPSHPREPTARVRAVP